MIDKNVCHPEQKASTRVAYIAATDDSCGGALAVGEAFKLIGIKILSI